MYKHILLPTDASEPAVKAELECIALAKALGSEITAIHVVEHPGVPRERAENVGELEKQYHQFARKDAEAMNALHLGGAALTMQV